MNEPAQEPKIVCPVCHEPCIEQDVTSLGYACQLTPLVLIEIPSAVKIESAPCGHILITTHSR